MKKLFIWTNTATLNQTDLSLSQLEPDTQKHIKALRPHPGDEILLSDGKGQVSHFHLHHKDTLLHSKTVQQKPSSFKIHLLLSPPKGDSLNDAIAYATQLGVAEITLFKSDLCQLTSAQMKSNSFLQRIQRVSDSWAESAERAFGVSIQSLDIGVKDLLGSARLVQSNQPLVFADEKLSEKNQWGFNSSIQKPFKTDRLFIVIGPEGGFSPTERKLLNSYPSVMAISLGPQILKVPVAVAAALTLLQITLSQKQL